MASKRQLEILAGAKANNIKKLGNLKRDNQGESLISNLDKLKATTIHRNARRSTKWFENKIASGKIDKKYLKSKVTVGRMFAFSYFPKGHQTLPHYDLHPLVLPIGPYSDGFLGINLHYLHPKMRIILLNKLDKFAKGSGDNRRLALSYNLLKNASSLKAFKPCIKRYLYSHVKSQFAMIPAEEWELAAFMPLASFVGSTKDKVYKESLAKMGEKSKIKKQR